MMDAHLERVCLKLDIPSRVEPTALAVQHHGRVAGPERIRPVKNTCSRDAGDPHA